jgi:hypothetical protein
LVYQKTFFYSRFTKGTNILGHTEDNGVHRLDFKEKVKEKVYLNSLEIGVFLDDLPIYYNVDLGSATCHGIKEDFANGAYLMTVCRLVVSGEKFFRDFHRFLEKVIDVFSVYGRLRNVNLTNLPVSRALRLSLESISLTPKVFGALFWHKKIKNNLNTSVLNMGTYSQSAIQTCN